MTDLSINLTKYIHNIHVQNYKLLVKEDVDRQNDKLHSWIERVNIVKVSIFLILISKFIVLIKILVLFL